jgi:hypothetical protein
MFLSVFWEGYITLVLVILVPYYVFVLLKYFRRGVFNLARWASVQQKAENDDVDEETDEDVPGIRAGYTAADMGSEGAEIGKSDGHEQSGWQPDKERKDGQEPGEWQPPGKEVRSLLLVAQELTVELKDFVGKAAQTGMVREELIMGLKVLLDKEPYRALREQPFRGSVNNVIVLEVANNCSIHLDAGEMERLWER